MSDIAMWLKFYRWLNWQDGSISKPGCRGKIRIKPMDDSMNRHIPQVLLLDLPTYRT